MGFYKGTHMLKYGTYLFKYNCPMCLDKGIHVLRVPREDSKRVLM